MPRLLRPAAVLALLLSAAPLAAQGAPSAPAAAPAVSPRTVALADTLLRAMNMEETLRAAARVSFDQMIEQNPTMEQFRDVMTAWLEKHLSWTGMGPQMVQVYAEMFTDPELEAMLTFYRSPAGLRLAALTPELSRRGAAIGAAVATEHAPELQAMIQARMAELQGSAAPPPR